MKRKITKRIEREGDITFYNNLYGSRDSQMQNTLDNLISIGIVWKEALYNLKNLPPSGKPNTFVLKGVAPNGKEVFFEGRERMIHCGGKRKKVGEVRDMTRQQFEEFGK